MRGNPRFKITSHPMPHTGRRRWHLKMLHRTGASTLTVSKSHAEAVASYDRLTRVRNPVHVR